MEEAGSQSELSGNSAIGEGFGESNASSPGKLVDEEMDKLEAEKRTILTKIKKRLKNLTIQKSLADNKLSDSSTFESF